MGLLDSILGNVLGGGMPSRRSPMGGGAALLMQIVAALLARRGAAGAGVLGGLPGLAEQFQRRGLGDVMDSWISTGPNRAVAPDQLGDVLGGDLLGELTQHTGMDRGEVLGQLSEVLPQMVDQATPDGRIPEEGLGDIGAILERFGGAPR